MKKEDLLRQIDQLEATLLFRILDDDDYKSLGLSQKIDNLITKAWLSLRETKALLKAEIKQSK